MVQRLVGALVVGASAALDSSIHPAPHPPPSATQGLKTLTLSSSHPAGALEAKNIKQEGEDWFPIFPAS